MDGPLFFDGAAMAGFESFGIGPGHAAGLPPSAVLPGRHRKLGGKGKSLTPLGKPTPGTATLSADNAAWMARNTNVRFGAHVIDASEAMEGHCVSIFQQRLSTASGIPASTQPLPSHEAIKFVCNITTRLCIDLYSRACSAKDPNEADLENVAGQQGGDPLILLADTGGEPIAGLLYETLAPTQENAGSEADIAWQQAAEVVVGARQEATPRIMKDSARARTVRSASVEAALPGIFPGDLGTNAAELCTTLALEFSKARDNASGGCSSSSSSSSYGGGSGGGGGGGTFGPGDVGLTLPFGIVFELLARTHPKHKPSSLTVVLLSAVLEFFIGEIMVLLARVATFSKERDLSAGTQLVAGVKIEQIKHAIVDDVELSQVVSGAALFPHVASNLACFKERGQGKSGSESESMSASASVADLFGVGAGVCTGAIAGARSAGSARPVTGPIHPFEKAPRLCYRCGLTGHLSQDCSSSVSVRAKRGGELFDGPELYDEEESVYSDEDDDDWG